MLIPVDVLKAILAKFVKQAGPDEVRKRMEKAIPKIIAGMREDGFVPESEALWEVVRDALFRLWKAVVRSGPLADVFRDSQEAKVLALVRASVLPGVEPSLEAIVKATAEAAIAVTF